MKINEQETLCASCAIQPQCGCNSIDETQNYNLDEAWNKYRIRMKCVVWECPDYELDRVFRKALQKTVTKDSPKVRRKKGE